MGEPEQGNGRTMTERSAAQILVVDDDIQFRRFVVRVLESNGFAVIQADGFQAAIQLIETDIQIDLLISDVALGAGRPHGVSLGNMAKLRRPNLKIIYISGSVDVHLAAQFGRAAAVLEKPFVARALTETIEKVLALDAGLTHDSKDTEG